MIYASASGLVGQFAVCTAAIGIVDECFFAVVVTGQVGEEFVTMRREKSLHLRRPYHKTSEVRGDLS